MDPSKLLKAISYVLKNSEDTRERYKKVDDFKVYILNSDLDIEALKEDIINAAIAIKLAMNLFEWEAA